jgi:hypothetical protein
LREQTARLPGRSRQKQPAETSQAVTLSCELLNLSRIISRGASE